MGEVACATEAGFRRYRAEIAAFASQERPRPGYAHVEDVVAGTPSDGFPELSVKGACRLPRDGAEFAEGDLAVQVAGDEVDLLLHGAVL